MTGDEIECPYHGWAFDGTGACIRIPGMPAPCDHTHQRAQAVAAIESEGLVWVRVGDPKDSTSELPASRHVSFGDTRFDTFLWPASAQCALVDGLENLLDACHPHFAHAGLVRRSHKRKSVEVTIRRTAEMAEAVYIENRVAEGVIPRLLEGTRLSSIGRFFPPSVAQLEYSGAKGPRFLLTSLFTPCDERTVLIHSVISTPRGLAPAWLKKLVLRAVFGRILRQDQEVLRRQQANIDRFGAAQFTSTPLDVMRPHIHYLLSHSDPAARSNHEAKLTMEL
jgi:phenylpropionate dioxygenase-like ring-hydroxylating dioxygenase large terminal subunit